MTDNDYQIGGEHYKDKGVQPWDAMEAWFSPEEFTGYLLGNVVKYTARWKEKGGMQDLYKAQHYLSKCIVYLEELEE